MCRNIFTMIKSFKDLSWNIFFRNDLSFINAHTHKKKLEYAVETRMAAILNDDCWYFMPLSIPITHNVLFRIS